MRRLLRARSSRLEKPGPHRIEIPAADGGNSSRPRRRSEASLRQSRCSFGKRERPPLPGLADGTACWLKGSALRVPQCAPCPTAGADFNPDAHGGCRWTSFALPPRLGFGPGCIQGVVKVVENGMGFTAVIHQPVDPLLGSQERSCLANSAGAAGDRLG